MPLIPADKLLRGVASQPAPYPAGSIRAKARAQALELAAEEGIVHAAYTYAIVPLDAPPAETLRAGGEAFHAPWLLPEAGELTALAFAVCTVGPAIETRVRELFMRRQASVALALDALGNELLFAAVRRAQDLLMAEVKRQGLTMAGELRPGDPGMALDAQGGVLRLAKAEEIGVTVNRLNVLTPMKSGSAVLGVGRDLPPARWSRCDTCPSRKGCKLVKLETAQV